MSKKNRGQRRPEPPPDPPAAPAPPERAEHQQTVEMPAPTAWPLVLALGIALLGMGLATSHVLSLIGAVIFVAGLAGWISQLLPGQGHEWEPVSSEVPPAPTAATGAVEPLRVGVPGYRFRVPEKVHPISAGFKGGIAGGLVMPIPALIYGLVSGHGIWFPVNLLAGLVMPRIGNMDLPQLEQFDLSALLLGIVIHVVLSIGFGVIYGVVLPTLPTFRGSPLIWGGVLMPLLWTGLTYGLIGVINPAMEKYVEWRWFLISQFVYGLVMATVVYRTEKIHIPPAGRGPESMAEYVTGSEGEQA